MLLLCSRTRSYGERDSEWTAYWKRIWGMIGTGSLTCMAMIRKGIPCATMSTAFSKTMSSTRRSSAMKPSARSSCDGGFSFLRRASSSSSVSVPGRQLHGSNHRSQKLGLDSWQKKKKELKQAAHQILTLLQDNYPEFVAKKIFINASWWYLAYYTMITPFVSLRTSSKFVAARPAKVSDTLFKYFSPEHVPVQYGGLSRVNDPDFSAAKGGVSELILKAGKQIIEIPATEVGSALVYEVTVVGRDVSYGAEFVPGAEASYTMIIHKRKKFPPTEEPVRHSFKIGEPGKVVLTVENNSSKRKKILYRSKVISA